VAHAVATVLHSVLVLAGCVPVGGVSCTPDQAVDHLSKPVLDEIAGPLLTSAQFLIPAAVAISGIHKMMEHRESGGSFLELADLPPVVVAYIVPGTRRNREHPLTKRYLAAIRQRASCIVNLPDDADRVRYAGMEGVPVQDVSPALGGAYRELVEAVAGLPKRRGS
jgi:hypothetical protein